jgi:L-histidine N-alpha-methyltransferase
VKEFHVPDQSSNGPAQSAPAIPLHDHLPPDFAADALRRDAARGLTSSPKSLPPKWFYDKTGSDLFEEITTLPEYYPTRAEREILTERAEEIVRVTGCDTLVELGSGSSEKTRLLLTALTALTGGRVAGRDDGNATPAYVALDVSEDALRDACAALAVRYPELAIQAVRADFEFQLDVVPPGGRRLVAFLGGTIGNLEPPQRAQFFRRLRAGLRPGDHLLLGADLVKSPDVLIPAYDDAAGVTAAFNRNVLTVLNNGLGADFRHEDFEHVAIWDPENEWIEMRLRAVRDVLVGVPALELAVAFDAGEEMRTEISAKFRRQGLAAELAAAGFDAAGWWTDAEGRFSLSLWSPAT